MARGPAHQTTRKQEASCPYFGREPGRALPTLQLWRAARDMGTSAQVCGARPSPIGPLAGPGSVGRADRLVGRLSWPGQLGASQVDARHTGPHNRDHGWAGAGRHLCNVAVATAAGTTSAALANSPAHEFAAASASPAQRCTAFRGSYRPATSALQVAGLRGWRWIKPSA